MISENDLVGIVRLFLGGFAVGALLSAIPFMIGYIINWLYTLVRKE